MKLLFYCALIGVVLAGGAPPQPLVTGISSSFANVATVNLPTNEGQRLIGFPIGGSTIADIGGGTIGITVTGTNLPVGTPASLVAISKCQGSACCTAVNSVAAVQLTTQVALTAPSTTLFSDATRRSLAFAYDPRFRLVDGAELCLRLGALPPFTGLATGAMVRLYWSCSQTVVPVAGFPIRQCGSFVDVFGVDQAPLLMSLVPQAEYASEVFGKTTSTSTTISADAHECECTNPSNNNFASCSGRVFNTLLYKCCGSTLVGIAERCPCLRSNTPGGSGAVSSQCPAATPNCCLQAKFGQLALAGDQGVCFNPATESCCDTGAAFDRGTSRCCPINGVQSLDIPCPCTIDAHCSAGTFLNGQREAQQTNMACCVQSTPALADPSFCNIFVNFPSGSGNARTALCSGFCINTDYQLCCNGVACLAMYEKCCNTTCCNRFIGTCDKAKRGPEWTILETCSTIQQMNPLRAFWLFIFPAALLFATLTALALALIFANKAASREFSVTERWMIVFSVLLSILIIPLYFSPLYKYGLFMVLVASWTILTAAVRVKLLNVVAVALYIILFVYLFDPFTGSQFLNLAYFRDQNGITDFRSNGIWHTTKRLAEPTIAQVPTFRMCTDYFDYFRLDDRLRDFRTDNYRVTTFGYCSNQYILALYLFEGFQILCALVLTVLSVIGLVLRFRKKAADPIELEIVPQ